VLIVAAGAGVQVSGTADASLFTTDATVGAINAHTPVAIELDVCITYSTT